MNRKERREYERKIKNDKRASICPKCGYKSLFFSRAVLKPYEGTKEKFEKEDFNTQICCEVCNSVLYEGDEITKLVPPGVYLPTPLEVFDYALRHPEIAEREELNDQKHPIVDSDVV